MVHQKFDFPLQNSYSACCLKVSRAQAQGLRNGCSSSLPVLPERLLSFQDSQGGDIAVGACLEGIFVKHKNGRPPVMFRYFPPIFLCTLWGSCWWYCLVPVLVLLLVSLSQGLIRRWKHALPGINQPLTAVVLFCKLLSSKPNGQKT